MVFQSIPSHLCSHPFHPPIVFKCQQRDPELGSGAEAESPSELSVLYPDLSYPSIQDNNAKAARFSPSAKQLTKKAERRKFLYNFLTSGLPSLCRPDSSRVRTHAHALTCVFNVISLSNSEHPLSAFKMAATHYGFIQERHQTSIRGRQSFSASLTWQFP